ncbi:MAG: hypothetical protein RLZZ126_1252 [Pseudomonadota bacterium]|jgi:general secretion pathway protein J
MRAGRCNRGFTLVELLIAISIMAVMAALSWRGLDGMLLAQTRVQTHSAAVQALQAGLAQWGADLDAALPVGSQPALDWDGRALRLTRPASTLGPGGVVVVAWSRRDIGQVGQWLRWQSPPVLTRAGLQQAWTQAAQWAQNPGDDLKAHEVRVMPLQAWQIYFFRGNAWSNPLSDAEAAPGSTGPSSTSLPDGVRLVLSPGKDGVLTGPITRDWVRPTLGGKG